MNQRKPEEAYPFDRAWRYALWLLGRQGYTTAQLRERLRRKGALDDDIETIIARLTDLDYLDDVEFAASYVRTRKARKGALALRRELIQKGVPEALAEKSLEPLDETAQLEVAKALLERQRWRFEKGDSQQRKARAYAFLARRGFPGDVVREALEASELFSKP